MGRTALLAGVFGSALFTYLAVRDVEFAVFWDALEGSDWWLLVPALAVLAVGVYLRAVRWYLLFEPATRPPHDATLRALLVGYFFNNILPARAGEAARILFLHRETGTSRAESLGTAVVERIYDLVWLFLLLFAATPFVPDVSWLRRAALLALVLAILIVAVTAALVVFGARPVRFILRPLTRLRGVSADRVDEIAERMVLGLAALHRPRLAVPAFAVTALSWLVVAVSFWLVLAAFDLGLGLGAGLLVLVTTNLAMVLPSLPAAVGVFEAATIVALRAYGVDTSTALGCAVMLHAVNFFPFLAAGYVVLHSHAFGWSRRAQAAPRIDEHAGGGRPSGYRTPDREQDPPDDRARAGAPPRPRRPDRADSAGNLDGRRPGDAGGRSS